MSQAGPIETARRPDWAALCISAFLLAIAGIVVWDMMRLPPPGRYDPLGATGFPYLVAGGLLVLAVLTAFNAIRGSFPDRERQEFLPLLFVVGGLLVQMALLRMAGFAVATGLLFAATAYGFGEKRVHLTLPFGLGLAVLVWFIFARLLKLTLPEGPPEQWMIQAINSLSGGG